MALSEKELEYLENHIPELAEYATKEAYWRALAMGSSVLVASNGFLIEVFPDGTQKIIKEIAKPTEITQKHFSIRKP
ncbi:MAG: hypothetical protein MUE30_10055 [Spirosomaceae bacterium]|jgi:hypothetical protein|nr:hypothetical protein [Spirosomataceae bacterium]